MNSALLPRSTYAYSLPLSHWRAKKVPSARGWPISGRSLG
ncbi:hypothetical protein Paride_0404 [Pseudomonas phage Paride]|nr:hypothetical protein Paride_0404 [Pseudomonas phage Paride]